MNSRRNRHSLFHTQIWARSASTASSYLLAFALLLSPPAVRSGSPLPDAARKGFAAIRAENMEIFLRFLAADELEGRSTGERGGNIAALFLESQYRLAGLVPAPGQNSMLQTFTVLKSALLPETSLTVKKGKSRKARFTVFTDFVLSSRHHEPVTVQGRTLFAGFGATIDATGYDDFRDIDATNKILLVFDGAPGAVLDTSRQHRVFHRGLREQRRRKAKRAQEAGAAAIIFINRQLSQQQLARAARWLRRPSYELYPHPDDATIPQLIVSEKTAEAIFAAARKSLAHVLKKMSKTHRPVAFELKKVRLAVEIKVASSRQKTQNVVAFLPGSDTALSHEVVAFGAHYDHLGAGDDGEIYNGADDDGSGTVALLEIARAFAANPVRPRRSLIFISHTGEERGLLGSRYYTDNPAVPLDSTMAQLNIDMIGRNDDNAVYIIGSNFLSRELDQLNEEANREIGLHLDPKYNRTDDPQRFYYRSDHYNYAKHDVPVIFYFSGTHEDYHKPTDTVDKINFHKMERIARLVFLTGWYVANLDHPLRHDGILRDKPGADH